MENIAINIRNSVPTARKMVVSKKGEEERDNKDKWTNLSPNDLKMLLACRNLSTTGGKEEMIRKLKEYDDWDRFTMKELKNELSKRGLSVSGSKDELIKKLVEGNGKTKETAETIIIEVHHKEEKPKKKQKVQEIAVPVVEAVPVVPGKNRVIPQAFAPYMEPQALGVTVLESPRCLEPPAKQSAGVSLKGKKRSATCGLFFSLTINELKAALAQRNLKVSGSKDELVHRLTEFEEWNSLSIAEIHAELTCRGLPISGTKGELIERLTAFEEINNMNVNELKAALSARQLPCTGRKDELVVRLLYCKGLR